MYIDKIDDKGNEYDKTYNRKNSIRQVDVTLTTYIGFSTESHSTILNLKVSLILNSKFLNLNLKIQI